jgi:hypothetical protein
MMVKQTGIPGLDHYFCDGQWLQTENFHRPQDVIRKTRKPSAKGKAQQEAIERTLSILLGDDMASW